MDRLVLRNINGDVFYDSDKHIHGDTRIKPRCNGYDYIWAYMTKDDYDGVIMNKCIAIDTRELKDLQARGVKFYECRYAGGVKYRIEIAKFLQWSHPVVNRIGDGEQVCASWRHWQETEKKVRKAKVSALPKVLPLSRASSMVQERLF